MAPHLSPIRFPLYLSTAVVIEAAGKVTRRCWNRMEITMEIGFNVCAHMAHAYAVPLIQARLGDEVVLTRLLEH
jgi:hypothetical protein